MPKPAQPDKLTVIRQHAAAARDLELEIIDLQASLKAKGELLNNLYFSVLPDLLDEAQLDTIGVPPDGNKPGVDYVLSAYYSASIPKAWSDEKREEAFALLRKLKAESLIKTEVGAKLPKGNLKQAKLIAAAIKKMKLTGAAIYLNQEVHASTLKAWLKEIYDRGQTLSITDLEKISGKVGRYVKPKDRKE